MNLEKFKKAPKNLTFKDLIIFENDNFIAINKPPFISSLDERTEDKTASIIRLAKEEFEDIQLCHRLDKETSGVLILAKNPEAYRHMAIQFEQREVTKTYHAVANGQHNLDSISVFLPIAINKGSTQVRIDKRKGKIAETIFFTEKVYGHHTLIRCHPISGRMHQIRVHLMCLEAPIVCDPTYGGADIFLSKIKRNFNLKENDDELPLIKRVALHAYEIQFKDLNGEVLKITAPYPKDFDVLIKQLDKYSS
ncbi:23S rRNA pseudouridine955/2504/2580 synthase [Spirosomataceae bacterium TFI 002]|nr:23S rRNA pseudouridine955/2504/2580 synthase [Spirosomataceae bacterium TFI 002]